MWVNISDRLPEPGKQVLVFSKVYGKVIAFLDDDGKWCARDTDYETGEPWLRDNNSQVTHWCVLPNDPV